MVLDAVAWRGGEQRRPEHHDIGPTNPPERKKLNRKRACPTPETGFGFRRQRPKRARFVPACRGHRMSGAGAAGPRRANQKGRHAIGGGWPATDGRRSAEAAIAACRCAESRPAFGGSIAGMWTHCTRFGRRSRAEMSRNATAATTRNAGGGKPATNDRNSPRRWPRRCTRSLSREEHPKAGAELAGAVGEPQTTRCHPPAAREAPRRTASEPLPLHEGRCARSRPLSSASMIPSIEVQLVGGLLRAESLRSRWPEPPPSVRGHRSSIGAGIAIIWDCSEFGNRGLHLAARSRLPPCIGPIYARPENPSTTLRRGLIHAR